MSQIRLNDPYIMVLPKKYKLLIFDIDGTILDTSEGIISSIKFFLIGIYSNYFFINRIIPFELNILHFIMFKK